MNWPRDKSQALTKTSAFHSPHIKKKEVTARDNTP